VTLTPSEQAALDNLNTYAERFRLTAAAQKIAALQEECERLTSQLLATQDRYIRGEETPSERKERLAKERRELAADWNDELRMEDMREAAQC
jgi:hypothetical protein